MTNQEIINTGQQIATEQHIGGNTAARVGGVVEGIGVALNNKDAANGYYEARMSGGSIIVTAPNFVLGTGGNLRLKMPAAGTVASTLTIGNASQVPLLYNGAAVTPRNGWDEGEIIDVFYDGQNFLASNSEGGGDVKVEDNTTGADLDINDDRNNTLVRFSDGHVKTKNFDSRDLKTFVDDNETSDLSLDDENDYSIVQFKNGHIITKNFDSSKVRYANYKDYQRRVFFTHTVNCVNWLDTSFNAAGINTMEDIVEYSDNCVLYLPTSYSKTGSPCKLIIYCKHGASTIEPSADDILTGSMGKIFRYMLSLGYAIVAADGVPNGWTSAIGLSERSSGNYVAVQSTIKAYNYVTENYNISKNDVMIFGWSQGGAYALNVIENTSIPISCAALLSPVISFRYHLWDAGSSVTIGGVTYTKAARLNVARMFNFPAVTTNAQLLALEYDYGKTSGFDPWFRNVDDMYTGFVQDGILWKLPNGVSLDDITMKKHLKCPVKVWFAENDAVLGCDVGKVFVRALKNAGVSSDIEIKSTGGHDILSGQTSIGSFIENGQSVSLYPMAKDIATWYNINGGY